VSDDFFSDAVPSCSFAGDPPIVWEGRILTLEKKQATTFDPDTPGGGEPRFWPDGNPMMFGWITLKTNVRNPEVEDDDGIRVLVLDSKNKREAVQKAVKATGTKIKVGGWVRVEFYGRDPNGKNKDNLPKLYRAEYKPPTGDDFLDEATPTQLPQAGVSASTPTATATPSPAPASANSGGGVDPAHAANVVKLVQAGVPVDGKTPEQIALIASAL
jgi:hypothetical protein